MSSEKVSPGLSSCSSFFSSLCWLPDPPAEPLFSQVPLADRFLRKTREFSCKRTRRQACELDGQKRDRACARAD